MRFGTFGPDMASIFGHVAASSALGVSFFSKQAHRKALLLAGFCAFAPDLDVLAFSFGVPYSDIWGHRGWTHSIVFALALGITASWLISRRDPENRFKYMFWMFLATLSHPLLDMLTNGGLGVAVFFPFDNTRYFFPVRPIQVSPLGVGGFVSKWGLHVLLSEFYWIGLPSLVMVAGSWLWRRKNA